MSSTISLRYSRRARLALCDARCRVLSWCGVSATIVLFFGNLSPPIVVYVVCLCWVDGSAPLPPIVCVACVVGGGV